jgi:hypothetical protein
VNPTTEHIVPERGREGMHMDRQHEFETVFTGTSAEVGLARGFLEEHGLEAYLTDDHLGTTAPYVAAGGGAGAVKLQVAGADAVRARELLAFRVGPA